MTGRTEADSCSRRRWRRGLAAICSPGAARSPWRSAGSQLRASRAWIGLGRASPRRPDLSFDDYGALAERTPLCFLRSSRAVPEIEYGPQSSQEQGAAQEHPTGGDSSAQRSDRSAFIVHSSARWRPRTCLKPNPSLGQNFVALAPLQWLARMTDHIPDPGKHRTLFYGHYANRARGAWEREKALLAADPAEAPQKRRCSPSWARLIAKVYHDDPLTCRDCGGPLAIVAYLHDQWAIRQILDHLGLSPTEGERPPPEVRYIAVDDEGRELGVTARVAERP